MRVTVVPRDGPTTETIRDVQAKDLVGEYRLGDGLGYNLHLVLKGNGAFECKWTGCLGVYGTSSGGWTLQEAGLALTTHRSDGMLKDQPIEWLRGVVFDGQYLLLQKRDLDKFKEYGPVTFHCFHQKAVRQALVDWRARALTGAAKPDGKPPKD